MKNRNILLVITIFIFLGKTIFAQRNVYNVVPNRLVDSVYLDIYRSDHPNLKEDRYGIEYTRSFGYLQNSKKFNTDSFFQWTKQFCIEKVGATFFYENFKLNWYSFQHLDATETYRITYFLEPFKDSTLRDNGANFIRFDFKHYDFLGKSMIETPENLPECVKNPELCKFKYDRKKVEKLTYRKIVKGAKTYKSERPYMTINQSLQWEVRVEIEGKGMKSFTVDSRTGKMSEVSTGWICRPSTTHSNQ